MRGLIWLGWMTLICIAIRMIVTVTFKAVEMLAYGRLP